MKWPAPGQRIHWRKSSAISTLKELQVKLAELRRQEAELSAVLTPGSQQSPAGNGADSRAETAMNTKRDDILGRVRNDYQAAQRREKLLQAQYDEQVKTVSSQSEKAIHYNILKREVDTNRQVYESILQRMKEAGVAAAMRASNIRIVDPAVPPSRPFKPNPRWPRVWACCSGFWRVSGWCSCGKPPTGPCRSRTMPPVISISRNWVSSLPLSPEPARECHTDRSSLKRTLQPNGTDGSGHGITNGNGTPKNDRLELVTWQKKTSFLAESFQATLTSILFAGHEDSRARLLLVTSPSPGEGKSTIISNLGIALAD